ncbi:hypothetical protein SEUBUCD646_0G03330 [Saccharomyces eubayanus]|uniref:Pre-mRNA-splicing factor 38 n=2 Tax=Saccharomyces TaxID=4930 RepID=A0A6C1E7Y8_SACPS|nr:PRP38-like protein [Saccharomyces eubayanus]KOG99567.1 PRP38-like protein [Saccharomyces eubayanus]QID85139.1 U4/U6-U5 snRNP complex subunit prp38 [Saccharomyces pastorianus]CAI2004431.1 hypothetical protein SEUBUCD650_0G03310 [Saccharomyces eubayanus]CAI2023420.1 hypothetical protein SEUBUCD646_0G03330 [Saccharomyces eubayanus]
MATKEFQVESHISLKQLNNQSVSLIIPRLTRDKIHNSMYYKVNLSNESLRGNTMVELLKVIIGKFGALKDQDGHMNMSVLGGVEFKCILMKLVEIRPTLQQLTFLLNVNDSNTFSSKYITALILVYARLQYYYLNDKNNNDTNADDLVKLFKVQLYKYSQQFSKLKSFPLQVDCFAHSNNEELCIIRVDELVDWLVTQDHIWGIPLGKCQWSKIYDSEEESSSSGSDYEDDSESGSDSGSES